MNWYSIFYWLSVASSVRGLMIGVIVVFGLIALILLLVIMAEGKNKENRKEVRSWSWIVLPILFVSCMIVALTPSRKDTLLIIAGGGIMEFATNDSTAKQIPHEAMTFVMGKLKAYAKDAEVDFMVDDTKTKVLKEAKNMTGEELIEKMKLDSNFANILLNK